MKNRTSVNSVTKETCESATDRDEAPVSSDDDSSPASQGESIDEGKGRVFPCDRCGADLVFSIGMQSLQCDYCGYIKQIELPKGAPIVERDYQEMLERLERWHESDASERDSSTDEHVIRCDSCGGEVLFQGNLTSTHCPYCASPLQRDNIHDAPRRISVDGVLPFQVPQTVAANQLRRWIKSLWFAPTEFQRQGVQGHFNGVYLPFYTYDSLTFTRFTGQRGDYYYVTVGTGNNTRRERRIRWTSADGQFQRFFDDVVIIAAQHQNESLVRSLEPWPLEKCVPFRQELLAGFLARTYDVTLPMGFELARRRIEEAIDIDVHRRIGGDVQNVISQKTG
ncbi:MAG: hypothetical protein FJ267_15055, partial [Planctomycetes bacterium]|nr:hypothetical protein [Planctomycetota bacterium]